MSVTQIIPCKCGHPRTMHLITPASPFRSAHCHLCECEGFSDEATTVEVVTLTLTPFEVAIIRGALESAEYWDLGQGEGLPHNDGFLILPEDDDDGRWYEGGTPGEEEQVYVDRAREMRAISDRLARAAKPRVEEAAN